MGEVEFSHLTAVALSVNIQMGKTFPTLLTIFSKKYSFLKIEKQNLPHSKKGFSISQATMLRRSIMTAFEMCLSENL